MKDILVLGGGGYIGGVLVPCLLDLGYKVRVIDRFFFGKESLVDHISNPNLELIKDDIRYFNPELLRGVHTIIDLAGMSNDPAADLNPEVTLSIHAGASRVAMVAKATGVSRYIYSSSCSVYGHGKSLKLTEESEPNPVSLYARTKLDAENRLLDLASNNFCVSLLRHSTVYGLSPRMRFDLVVNLMTLTAWQSGKIYVTGGGEQWRPLVHVKDVVRAFLLVLESYPEKVASKIFNVGSSEQNYQIKQIANMVKRVLPTTQIIIVPEDVDKRTYSVNFDRIKTLGFIPACTIEDGIKEIKEALDSGIVKGDDIRTRTVKYYQYLLEADELLTEIKYEGKIF